MESIDTNTKQSLVALTRASTIASLSGISKIPDVELSEIPIELPVYAHWMAMILLSGQSLRITFKTHFMSNVARSLASRTFNSEPDSITKDRSLGFFREFSNLTAGEIKRSLANQGVQTGTSLPIMTKGFDEVFFPRQSGSFISRWRLSTADSSVYCSAHFDIIKKFTFKFDGQLSSVPDGDVEFL